MFTNLSWSRLIGYLDPNGNSGFFSSSSPSLGTDLSGRGVAFEELPEFPDFTIPRFGGIVSAREFPSSRTDQGIAFYTQDGAS
jgi:hypothetical protein